VKWVGYFIDCFRLSVFCASIKGKVCVRVCTNVYIMYIILLFMYNVCNVSVYNAGCEAVLILNSFSVFTAFFIRFS
jgi:hypothetical protein